MDIDHEVVQHHTRLRSLVLVLIKRLDLSQVWASLLHLRVITKEDLQTMERGRFNKCRRVLALIDHIEAGFPYRLYEFLRACQLAGQKDIISLVGVDSSFYDGPLKKIWLQPKWQTAERPSILPVIGEEGNTYEAFSNIARTTEKPLDSSWTGGAVRVCQVGGDRTQINALCWTDDHTLLVSSGYEQKVWRLTLADSGADDVRAVDEFCGFWVSSISCCRHTGLVALVAWSHACIYLQRRGHEAPERWEPRGVSKPDQVCLAPTGEIIVLPAHSQEVYVYNRPHKELLHTTQLVWDDVTGDDRHIARPELVRVCAGQDGIIAATTTDHRLVIASLRDHWIVPVGGKGYSKGKLYSPDWVCISPDQMVYVSNTGSKCISIFSEYSGWYVDDVHVDLDSAQSLSMDILFQDDQPPLMALGLDYGAVHICNLIKPKDKNPQQSKEKKNPGKGRRGRQKLGKLFGKHF